jgi:metal-responsive CopG/Arc/MetJ family transcriptional regulator
MDAQVTVRLPADLVRALERAERASSLKRSEILRRALRHYLGVSRSGKRRPADRVRDLLGSLETGVPDLAENHRKYVLESLGRGG